MDVKKNDIEIKLQERIKELNCLYGFAKIVEKPNIALEEIMQELIDLIPPAWQYPDSTCVRITFRGNEYKTKNFQITEWKQAADIMLNNEKKGSIEVYYTKQQSDSDEDPFLKDERALLDVLAGRLGRISERLQTQNVLKNRLEELERLQKTTVGRELKMIELKMEVDDLLKELGRKPKYKE